MLHDILVDLLPKVDLRVRRQLSEQLGAMQKPPPELMSLLVHDVIEVSGPLLEHAAVSDEDLIDVVKVGSDEQREKIARRAHLPRQVRETLEKAERRKRAVAEARDRKTDDIDSARPEATVVQAFTASVSDGHTRVSPQSPAVNAIIGETRVFEDIIRATVDWTFETGRDFEITHLSDTATRAFGRPAKSLKGRLLTDVCTLADPRKPSSSLQAILDRRRPFRNLIVETRDSIERTQGWWLSAVPSFDLHTGRFNGFRGTAREVLETDRMSVVNDNSRPPTHRARPAAPAQAERPAPNNHHHEIIVSPVARNIDKEAADLIQTLSHELRTPLNAILGFSEMIDHETWGPVSDEYHDKTKVILQSAQSLKNAITDVLDAAKIRAGKQHVGPKFFSLATVLKTSIEDVRPEAKLQRVTLLPPQLAKDVPMLNDPEYLERCIRKILAYAISDSRPGESLQVTAVRTTNHRVNIDIPLHGLPRSMKKKSVVAEITAQDPKESDSVGFSLSIAADLAQAIGGEIRLISDEGPTTILRLTIGDYPVEAPESAA